MGLLQKYMFDGMSRNDVIKDAIKKVREPADVARGDIVTRSRNLVPNSFTICVIPCYKNMGTS